MGSSPPALRSVLAGLLLAAVLATAVVFSMAERSYLITSSTAQWLAAFVVAAGVGLLAGLRRLLPPVSTALAQPLLWLAGVLTVAVMGRHLVDSLAIAAAELPISASLPGGFDLGDGLLWLVLVVGLGLSGGFEPPKSRSGLRLALGLALLLAPAWILVAMTLQPARLDAVWPGLDFVGAPWQPLLALAWVFALMGCERERLAGRRGIATWGPMLFAVGLIVFIPICLLELKVTSALTREPGAVLMRPGAVVFGYFGGRVGAGLEAAATLAGALSVLVFSARWRLAAGVLGRAELIVAATLAVLAVACFSLPHLILLASLLGWSSVIMGLPTRDLDG
ncbi:MAG: hypothetical protein CMP23_03415 [Rickettsiales bacterium]|nr:hypothetical protein [Rickettsiales bacterium]|tara:strand:- start:1210 stop:2220 length:1011 start_codon:yes stop_codon:yes gene_type:complete